jgi:hypothetical protein
VAVTTAGSQRTVIALVSSDVAQEDPLGTGPSAAVSASVTSPWAVQVNCTVGELGLSMVPLDAVHEYERLPGTGPLALAETVTDEPTIVSVGVAVTLETAAQLNVDPLGSVTCEPIVATLQAIATPTGVVARGATSKLAAPPQTTLPSLAVAESVMR